MTSAAAANFLESTGENHSDQIEQIMQNAADPEDTAALEKVATEFQTDEEIGDEIRLAARNADPMYNP